MTVFRQIGTDSGKNSGSFAALCVGICCGAWLIFAWPWLVGGETIPWDGKAHFAPQVQFMARSIASGASPWWAPNVFAGHPQIADPQSMLFSPPFILLALMDPAPGPWAIDCVVLLTLLAAALGVLWLTRDLGWYWAGGLVAAIAFAFGAAMAWRLQHFGQVMSLAYLPFALVFLRRAIQGPSVLFGVLAGLVSALILLGRDQVALLGIYLLAAYALTLLFEKGDRWRRIRRASPALVAGAVVAALLVAVPIFLTAALAQQSNRPAIAYLDAAAGSLHPALLVTSLTPHLFGAAGEMRDYWGPPSFYWEGTGLYLAQNMGVVYVGALGLVLILIGAFRGMLFERPIRFFTIAWFAVLIYGLGWYTPVFRALYEVVPGVALFRRPADAVFLVGALGALLAGYTVHRLFTSAQPFALLQRRWMAVLLFLAAMFILASAFAVILDRLSHATVPLLTAMAWVSFAIASLALALWLQPIRPIAAGLILAAQLSADLIINNGPNGASALPRTSLDMLELDGRNATIAQLKTLVAQSSSDTRRDRVEMVGLGYHWPNTPLSHNLDSTLGANPVRLKWYVSATGAGDTVAEGGQRAFPPLFPSYRSALADLLGLRYIATGAPIEEVDRKLEAGTFRLVAQTRDAKIYENPGALPRVLFAHNAVTAKHDGIIASGRWPTTDFTTTVILESEQDGTVRRRPGKIAIRSYRNTEIVLSVDSPDGGWAVLNDVWHPWWAGEIDGKQVAVQRANAIFRAIEVPPGRHTVRLVFRPLAGAWQQLTTNAFQPIPRIQEPQRAK